jgi:micrococcal nuclease
MPVARSPRRGRSARGSLGIVASICGGLAGCSDAGTCGPPNAIVERVIDGDTIVLTGGTIVRYLLVDAPETTDGHTECYGALAAQFNADLVAGKPVELGYDTACQDRYGRTLAYVTAGGHDVNRLLVERGYACVLHIPPDGDARAAEFEAVAAAARAAGRGLWGACDPIPCDAAQRSRL